jgi:putative methyltransferase (TIGR04325 family)
MKPAAAKQKVFRLMLMMERALSKLATLALTRTSVGSLSGRIWRLPKIYRHLTWSRPQYVNHFFGVFPTFAAARSAVPSPLNNGWEHDAIVAADYFQPSLYATLYWLARSVKEGSCIVDFGGGIGQTHREFAQRMALPKSVSWTVVDLAPAIRQGKELVAARGTAGLFFAERLDDLKVCDIFLSRGCLQYVESSLTDLISLLPKLPEYLLLDKIPLSDGPSFVTIQNLGLTAAPYKIFNRDSFLTPLLQQGYVVLDEWPVQDLSCAIAFHPDRFLPNHSGVFLKRAAV